jgi:hypothetical protein
MGAIHQDDLLQQVHMPKYRYLWGYCGLVLCIRSPASPKKWVVMMGVSTTQGSYCGPLWVCSEGAAQPCKEHCWWCAKLGWQRGCFKWSDPSSNLQRMLQKHRGSAHLQVGGDDGGFVLGCRMQWIFWCLCGISARYYSARLVSLYVWFSLQRRKITNLHYFHSSAGHACTGERVLHHCHGIEDEDIMLDETSCWMRRHAGWDVIMDA